MRTRQFVNHGGLYRLRTGDARAGRGPCDPHSVILSLFHRAKAGYTLEEQATGGGAAIAKIATVWGPSGLASICGIDALKRLARRIREHVGIFSLWTL